MIATVVGSGPGLCKHVAAATAGADVVITCNRAIRAYPNPTHHLVFDPEAATLLFDDWVGAVKRGVTLVWNPAIEGFEDIPGERLAVDPVFDCTARGCPRPGRFSYVRGRCTQSCSSGGLALQWVLNRGATDVRVVGCEGYRSNKFKIVEDYFDGEMGVRKGALNTDKQAKLIRSCIAACPDVKFTFYGDLAYTLPAHVVIVRPEQT